MIALAEIPYIGPFLAFAASRFGLPIVVAGGIVLFYEGIPIGPLRHIPFAGPALSYLVDGRVDRQYAAGQAAERADWQEKERLAARVKAAAEAAKQRELDAIEAEALKARIKSSDDDKRIAILEDDLETLQRTNPNDPPTGAPRSAPCIATPRSVSKQLNAIGR
ncbi:hypothetical protein [Mesorhizobium sp. CA4]|uniref:hypothetical protein n=1 Tax=Mesorhizobium sp. CA4 TaxID=588499 RepID=UPI001CD0FDA8|nr:hypothetical protein [Mesorhizobium sp. CA4]MBZ9822358.1 hypothetical protein [Mesorhizobium sp. CA4]